MYTIYKLVDGHVVEVFEFDSMLEVNEFLEIHLGGCVTSYKIHCDVDDRIKIPRRIFTLHDLRV